jgi:hypothetical protein
MGSRKSICCSSHWTRGTNADIHGSQIPIHLAEMSPLAFRATFPGVAYQLGNVCCIQWLCVQSQANTLL